MNDDGRRDGGAGACLDGVPQQIAERLAQQDIVAVEIAELAADLDIAAQSARLRAHFVGRTLADAAQDRRAQASAAPDARNSGNS